jgi:dimethylamine monooxygenase subunit A
MEFVMIDERAPWQRLGFELKLGLRARSEAEWLPSNDLFGNQAARAEQIALKTQLLAKYHQDVFSTMPNTNAAGDEVLTMVRQHLTAYHHDHAHDDHTHDYHPHDDRIAPADAGLHPLDRAARLVPEDLLLLAPFADAAKDEATAVKWHLVAASLCFPAHWVLAEKMGKPLAAIHGPVPHYDERLAGPVDRLFDKMTIGPISARMNWSLQIGTDLFTPHRAQRQAAAGDLDNNQLCLRLENQTLRKLPQTGFVLFTIRTHIEPVSRWKHTPNALDDLAKMLNNMSRESQSYKGASLYAGALTKPT